MSNLFGIENEADCRAKIDELLEMCHHAQRATNKETIKVLNDHLEDYYKKGDAIERRKRMSDDEEKYFWPAIQEAYVHRPKFNAPRTWQDRLYVVESDLRYYRPKKKQDS